MARSSQSNRIASLALLLIALLSSMTARGANPRYDFAIEMKGAFVSGILITAPGERENVTVGSLINEFGISLMDFSYNSENGKVKLISVMKKLDKWYIKRALKKDLSEVMKAIADGESEYYDKSHKIRFTFQPFENAEGESLQNQEQ